MVLHRTPDRLIQPEKDDALEGYHKGVLFRCSKVVIEGTLFVCDGGADKYVGWATCDLDELPGYLVTCPA